ncbi:phospholipid/cholesterol/gamma-HCH transport system ATP-binding protein [Desulfonatronum thiosulfatophilum]|uniref:Phospholipid/cholesterol/gamma-HCH transport system ATP-binding protein n=1 Tax=Desulfonatronum thiosulfatophilum TaxID=617002 RepID=A0A1G6BWN6_9BACT|nr:ATP-binding cassette domain-containing protein [Desulfonatronum thiosulfatophilum]SDB24937.1 phospholipid/cholesterol/gamma-HCH transport system ATP-binding protein [Desulfonatronum thiosulfatophilum]
MQESVIRFEKVCKSFNGNIVLKDVDLKIFSGQVTVIIGKSGVGKSVFLKHIIGLLKPDSGEIYFKEKPLSGMNRADMFALKSRFSYMFQNNALFDSMTVFENIALPLSEKTSLGPKIIREKVIERTTQLEISDVLNKYPSQISGGMQKRVALARALITDPEIVLFDEPTTGLDPIRKNAVLNMIAHYQRKLGFTAVVVSHDIPDVFYIADKVAIIDTQGIIFEGSPIFLEQSTDPEIQAFLNSVELLKDDLTGLDNRKEFMISFRQLRNSIRLGERFGFILLKLDGLDEVGEHVGHIAAQRIIQGISDGLITQLGDRGRAVRIGKNEIAAYFQVTDSSQIDAFRTAMLDRIGSMKRLTDGTKHQGYMNFCINLGITEIDEYPDLQALIMTARDDEQRVVCPVREKKEKK